MAAMATSQALSSTSYSAKFCTISSQAKQPATVDIALQTWPIPDSHNCTRSLHGAHLQRLKSQLPIKLLQYLAMETSKPAPNPPSNCHMPCLDPSAHQTAVFQPVVLWQLRADAYHGTHRNINVRGVVNDTRAHAQKCHMHDKLTTVWLLLYEIVCVSQIYMGVITFSCLGRTGTYFDSLAFLQTRWLWWCHTLPWDSQLRGRSRPELAPQSGSPCSWAERMHLQMAETSHSSAGEEDSIVETE